MSTQANVTKLDYYEVLSVSRTCGDADLKTSYRRLAMQYHPDRNPNNPEAEAKFREASEAYQVLSDPQKRAAYDRFGHAGVTGGADGNPFAGGVDISDIFGDIFGEMFNMNGQGGNGRRPSRAQRGRDIRFDLSIDFEEAVFGKETQVTIRRLEACLDCKGSGSAQGKAAAVCSQCGGKGQVRFQQGFFSIARTCAACGGTGAVIADPCRACRGDGRVEKEHAISVSIPAGVEDGTRIRYQGEGDGGKFDGPAGDLYLVLSVKSHEFFERDGNDLHCVIPVSFPQVALGAEIDVPTLEGQTKMRIAEGTQSGKEFRLRGKGVPFLNEHGRGDLVVQVVVETPKRLSKSQRDAIRQLGDTLEIENKPTSRSLLSKMKELFT
jgi:molecular chaperone DnaJ